MAVALDQFIRRVSESSVMSHDDITALLATLPAEKQPVDGEACAKLLVKEKKLTVYQAQQIYAGKGKTLVLGNYVILDKIGAGGMGQVFKARHKRMNRLVAIKLLPPEVNKDEATIQRFHREVQAAAKLTHPNIVIAYDADEAPGGLHFLVMEYVAGKDLAHHVANEKNLPVGKVLNYILQAAKGLAYAHENGVVHRDIKPANLLLDEKGTVKILDMGLARLNDAAAQAAKEGLTKSGDVMGTVDYMAPEQAFDTHNVDGRADIYSLGCTLYRLLTNSNLYNAESIVQKLMAHQSKPIPSLKQQRADVSDELQQAFEKMVAKQVEDRFQNMGEVTESLQAIYDSLTNSATLQPSKPDSKLKEFFRNLTGGGATKPGNDAPTSAVATSDKPQVVSSNPALDATINLSNPAQVTDPVSDRSIAAARTIVPQRQKPVGPWWRNRTVLIAAGAGGFLLVLLTIWVIIRDKDGKEKARIKVPEGGSAETKEVVEEKPVDKLGNVPESIKLIGPTTELSQIERLLSPDYEWREPESLGPVVNSAKQTIMPTLSDDQLCLIVFRNEGSGSKKNSLYEYRRPTVDGPWGDAVQVGAGDEGYPSLSSDGLLLFTKIEWKESKSARDIAMRTRPSRDAPWGQVKANASLNTKDVEDRPIISPDGLSLVFSSNRSGGLGSGDLWISRRADVKANWQPPVHLGNKVNTSDYDTAMQILADGKTILVNQKGGLLLTAPDTQGVYDLRPVPLPPNVKVSKCWLSPDGATLYFDNLRASELGEGANEIRLMRRVPKAKAAAALPFDGAKAIPAEALTFNGHRYLLVESFGTWAEAKAKAEAMGGHLVTITSREERDWILTNIFRKRSAADAANRASSIFLGGMTAGEKSPWTWITGESFDPALWLGSPATITGKSGLIWISDDQWNDLAYDNKNARGKYFLVEWDTLGSASASIAPPTVAPISKTNVLQSPAVAQIERLTSPDYEWTAPESLGPVVNATKKTEAPTLSDDQLCLVVVRSGTTPNSTGQFELRRSTIDEPWSEVGRIFGDNFSKSSLSSSGLMLYITPPETKNADGRTNRDISVFARATRNEPWGKPEEIPGVNSDRFEYRPVISPDGLSLVFGSFRPGGTGKLDLWISRRPNLNADWQPPVNLGKKVNSLNDENASQILADNQSILINRDADLFLATPNAQGVYESRPVPLPPDVKVSKCWLSPDGSILYFDTKRESIDADSEIRLMHRVPKKTTASVSRPIPPPAKAPFNAAQAKAHQEAWAKHLGTQVETVNSVGAKMILIPPGEFMMGSTPEQNEVGRKMGEDDKIKPENIYFQRLAEEMPQHKVTISQPFLMGSTEITVAQFRKFVETSKYVTEAEQYGSGDSAEKVLNDKMKETDKGKNWKSPGYVITDDTAVTQITWNDACAYCAWLSEQEQHQPWYRSDGKGGWLIAAHADGYRLPTEAEWEYACRAGTTTQFSFGDDKSQLEQFDWFTKNAGGIPQPVSLKLPNPFGLFDLHGNVKEWCQDSYDAKWYGRSSSNDPTGPVMDLHRVIRGGAWHNTASSCRAAYRYNNSPSTRNNFNGFRCVRTIDAPTTTAMIPQPASPAAVTRWPFDPPDGKEYVWSEPENLGPTVNSHEKESTPTVSADGLCLIFDSTRTGGGDLYESRRTNMNEPWGPAVALKTVNSNNFDTQPWLSDDGLTLLFCSSGERKGIKTIGKGDIWQTRRATRDAPWEAPVNLGDKINTVEAEGSPRLSPDGLTLYFINYGKIWFARRKSLDAPWETAVELGLRVNNFSIYFVQPLADSKLLLASHGSANSKTLWLVEPAVDGGFAVRQLEFPIPNIDWFWLMADGQSMLFSDDRPGGLGGRDIWITRRVPKTGNSAASEVDLLSLVDLTQDVKSGEWTKQGNDFQTAAKKAVDYQLQLPVDPGEEYSVRLAFTVDRGYPNLVLPFEGNGVPLGFMGGEVVLKLAGPIKRNDIDEKALNVTAPVADNFNDHRRHEVVVDVTRPDAERVRIAVKVDGRPTLNWTGTRAQLKAVPNASQPEPVLAFSSYTVKDAPTILHEAKLTTTRGTMKLLRDAAAAKSIPGVPALAIAPFDAKQARAHQEAWAKHLGVPVEYTNSIGMKFVLIPPGDFQMGASPEEIEELVQVLLNDPYVRSDETARDAVRSSSPRHKVILTKPFYLGVHEVTQKHYQAVTGRNPSCFAATGRREDLARKVAGRDTSNHPVEDVNLSDMLEFCHKLGEKEGFAPRKRTPGEKLDLVGASYRLPTEAEWEFACRAGSTTKFWTGDQAADVRAAAWTTSTSQGITHPVGELQPNPFGLFDIHGNVLEAVEDGWDPKFYEDSQGESAIDPCRQPAADSRWIMRGGSWYFDERMCNSAARLAGISTGHSESVGFRIVLTLQAVKASLHKQPPPAIAPFDAKQARTHQEAWAKHLGTEVVKPNIIGMQMTLIPPGEFLMGSSNADVTLALKIAEETKIEENGVKRIQEERPQHRVRITKPFRLAAHEVTIGQFAKFIEQAKYKTQAEEFGGNSDTVKPEEVEPNNRNLNWRTPGQVLTDDSPVTQVSWNDAVAFCNWLSSQEELDLCYQRDGNSWALLPKANGYRLPMEAEWEYACRAGTATQFWFGDDWKVHDEFGWSSKNAGGRPHAVGSCPANPFGLYDMHGNVWEWCHDWYDGKWYEISPSDDPLGPSSATNRVDRGGSWGNMPAYSRSSFRSYYNNPSDRNSYRGFRVVRSAEAVNQSPDSITPPSISWTAKIVKEVNTHFVAVSPNGRELIVTRPDTSHEIWDAKTLELLKVLPKTGASLATLDGFSGDGTMVGMAANKEIWIVRRSDGEPIHKLPIDREGANGVHFAAKQDLLVAHTSWWVNDGRCYVWDLANGDPTQIATFAAAAKASFMDLDISPDGLHAASVSNDGVCLVWELRTGREVERWPAIGAPFYCCKFSPDGSRIAAGSYYDGIYLFTRGKKEIGHVVQLPRDRGLVNGVAWTPDGKVLATATYKEPGPGPGSVQFWETATGKLISRFEEARPSRLHFLDGGKSLLMTNHDAAPVKLWNVPPELQAQSKAFDNPAFQQWMKEVQAMSAEQQIEAVSKKLVELNPGFDGKLFDGHWGGNDRAPTIEHGVVTAIGFECASITDISPVRALLELKSLYCTAKDKKSVLSDLAPLVGLKLESLYISYSSVSDLSPLAGMPMKDLACYFTRVTDLSPLREMPLKQLHCNSTLVSDLSPLTSCKNLQSLRLQATKVTADQVASLQKALSNCKIEWDDPMKPTTPMNAPAASK